VREADYQNQDVEMCIYYDTKGAKLSKGAYEVQIFIDGNLSGLGDFALK
jgi:hypothetical protein